MQIRRVSFFLVEDDLDDVTLFEEILREIDPSILFYSAGNGIEALEKLRSFGDKLPNYIFLDLNMPLMDGKQCLEELKKDDKLKNIPVIIFTTSSQSRDIEQTIQMGAACFITKPTSMKELKNILASIAESNSRNLRETIQQLSNVSSTFIVC
jgi:CheY-like chemotaxis protein